MFLEHALFGTKHLSILIVCLILIIVLSFFAKKIETKTMYRILLYVGIVSEIIKVMYFCVTNVEKFDGYLPKTDLPFHLCSIQIIFIFMLNFSKSEKLKRVLLSFMLPTCLFGGIAALLIATSSSRNGYWICSVQYFGYHTAITIFAIWLLTRKEIEWSIKDYKTGLLFLAALGFMAIYLNSILNDSILYDGKLLDEVEIQTESGESKSLKRGDKPNFMYVIDPPAEGLPFLNKNQGWFAYILKYAFLAFVLVSLAYIKPIIQCFRKKKALPEYAAETAYVPPEDSEEDETP